MEIKHPLLAAPICDYLIDLVSEIRGADWQIEQIRNLNDRACHPAAIVSDAKYAVFAKLSNDANGYEQFCIEKARLALLADLAGVRIPKILAIETIAGQSLMVMQAEEEIPRGPKEWRDIGRTLAKIHQVKGGYCGLDQQGYIGPWYLDNRPLKNWSEFYAERRLWPALANASNSGNLPSRYIRQLEGIIKRLPKLCGPEPEPCLLHGDAQQNNYISTPTGTVVIDPAVCYGHPEFDLAWVDYFQAVPKDVFDAYQTVLPIAPGFGKRKNLWRIYGYLAAVAIEGQAHLPLLEKAIKPYL